MTDAMEIVRAARASDKISGHFIRQNLFPDFFELHGDGVGGDDPAIVAGLATFHNRPVTVVTTSRGHSLDERINKHFGQPSPSGYRKALRVTQQAAEFNRPVFFFVDTAGAFPGKDAEYNGQGQAIAQCILKIGQAKTPIISVFYGEGGSGGALALACGDEVWMLKNSMYSVLSPEGFASIMWKDSSKVAQAAELLGLTPQKLLDGKVIEGIVPYREDKAKQCSEIDKILARELDKLSKLSKEELLENRYNRFRKF